MNAPPDLPSILRYEVDGQKCTITLNRPEAMNALSIELRDAIATAMRAFDADDDLVVAILTGEGGRAFSAGGDLKAHTANAAAGLYGQNAGWPPARSGKLSGYDDVDRAEKPVIAAIDGYCLGGGFELTLCCDIRVATRQSSFALPEVRRSMLGGPGLHLLSRAIPFGEAMRIHLTGSRISAERAYQIGIVQELAEDRTELFAIANGIADEIAKGSPLAVRTVKRIVKEGRNMPIEYSWKIADPYQQIVATSPDAYEGPARLRREAGPDLEPIAQVIGTSAASRSRS